ncbi:ATP-binding protein [Arthrobacter sp. UYCu712]|uniref:AAA family ATPase n=1 Tax=Arthrobacter sp. UYCu712 TaxID=3156340 RepID=UPI0033952FAC
MLLKFRVSNYRSFKEEAEFSALATRLDKGFGVPVTVALDGTAVDVLPVVAVLGANASGKSNLLRAMAAMRDLVLNSAARPAFRSLEIEPFLLDPTYSDKPTLMEINFSLRGARYQYGFEIQQGRVMEEWLQTFPHKRPQNIFDRQNTDDFQLREGFGKYGKFLTETTRPEVLFLSAAANAGHPLLSEIYEYFVRNLQVLDVAERGRVDEALIRRLLERRSKAVELLSMADLGILDAHVEQAERSQEELERIRSVIRDAIDFPEDSSEEQREAQVSDMMQHVTRDEGTIELVHRAGRRAMTLPFEQESHGTKSWLSFVTNALEIIENGGVLLIDELDASLHPLLLAQALRLFQSKETNPNGAQLIFSTHDVTLLGGTGDALDRYHLSRGQVWLTEKGRDGGSILTPLAEYKPRKGEDLVRGYLQGRYGGTPHLVPMASDALPGERIHG